MLPRPKPGAYACLDLLARPGHARGNLRRRRRVDSFSKHNGHALFYPARFARRRKADQNFMASRLAAMGLVHRKRRLREQIIALNAFISSAEKHPQGILKTDR